MSQNIAFNEAGWESFVHLIKDEITSIALPASLYGMLTILSVAAFISLVRRTGGLVLPTVILSFTLLALYISTTAYFVFQILATQNDMLSLAKNSIFIIWTLPPGVNPPSPFLTLNGVSLHCGCTAALAINILLGDGIVCWRVTMLWGGNRIVKGISVGLLVIAFALSIADTEQSCNPSSTQWWSSTLAGTPPDSGSMFQGLTYGVAACILSFSTNLFATLAVSYKAWATKKFCRKYFVSGDMFTKMERLLSILMESGAIYCALWTVVILWQIAMITPSINYAYGSGNVWDVFGIFISGALTPVIAIYPTIIIVLVALGKSHIEKGFSEPPTDWGPTMLLPMHSAGTSDSVTVDTAVSAYHDRRPPDSERSSTVIVVDGEAVALEGSSTHTSDPNEKCKTDDVV